MVERKRVGRTELRSMSDEELDATAMRLTAERADEETWFKDQQTLVQEERDRRDVTARVAEVSPEVRAAILADAGVKDEED